MDWLMKVEIPIKEVFIGDERIVIDFDGAPFWKYIAVSITILVMATIANRKPTWLVNYTGELE